MQGKAKGRLVTCSSKHPNADLWERFWQLIFDHGGLGPHLRIRWVKAHLNDDSEEACGNNWADALAKRGALVHETPKADVRLVKYMRRRYRQLIRWFGKSAGFLHSHGWSDRQHRSDLPVRTQQERVELEKLRSAQKPHSIDLPSFDVVPTVVVHSQVQNLRVGSSLVHAAKRARLEADMEEDGRRAEASAELDQCMGDASKPFEKPICTQCGTYRKILFREGIQCRELCPCDRRCKRRRLHYKQADKWGLFDTLEAQKVSVHERDAKGHLLFVYKDAGITWCMKCGAFTGTHIKDLGRECSGKPSLGKAACHRKLRRGLHPITGDVLGEAAQRLLVD